MDNYCHKAIQWRKAGLFNQWCQNNWIFISKAKDFNSYLTLHIKLNSKWTIDLNIRTKTIRCLEENTRGYFGKSEIGKVPPPPLEKGFRTLEEKEDKITASKFETSVYQKTASSK